MSGEQRPPSRPNKSLEPTPTAVRAPAAQDITSPCGVAQLKRSAKNMKAIALLIICVAVSQACAAASAKASLPGPEKLFSDGVEEAIDRYLEQRRADFENPKSVRLILMSPIAYTDSEYENARLAGKGEEPFWAGERAHEVFELHALKTEDAKLFGHSLIQDLLYSKTHDELRLLSFCLFRPMHGYEITFHDGTTFKGAICVHCGDLMFNLPWPGLFAYRGVQTQELSGLIAKLLPVPPNLERKYFPKDHDRR
jgi:hypothetical protein